MKKTIKITSWNVNGIRAVEKKGFLDWLKKENSDIICLQETKVQDPTSLSDTLQSPLEYQSFWNCDKEKKGYSGVVIYTKEKPIQVKTDFGNTLLSKEGRIVQLEYTNFILLNIYFPNGGRDEERLEYKIKFYKAFIQYIKKLDATGKKIIFCGDLNTAHNEIDLARPKANENNSGFMMKERKLLDEIAKEKFIDTYRYFYPDKKDSYSWWDMKTRSRERNVGWRIDYFWVNDKTKKHLKGANIHQDIVGSDHCPISLQIEI
ncbi:MAG: exodeoxyribonuclease III [Candidatus Magasanikbacteria bacterium]